MPALLHIYRAARKFSASLSKLPRGRAPKDKERLNKAKEDVARFLVRYGAPFNTNIACDVAFRIIDPEHVWSRGRAATSFKAACASFPEFNRQFEGEPFVTAPLGVLIMMARDIMRNRVAVPGQGRSHWSSNVWGTFEELESKGFKGNPQHQVLAQVLRESLPRGARSSARE
jgi:hypothetical protein